MPTTAKGFSLIELLVVMIIISILCGLGLIAYSKIHDQEVLKKASNQVKTGILEARDMALYGKKPSGNCDTLLSYKITFAAITPANYKIYVTCTNGGTSNDTLIKTVTMDKDVSLSANTFAFNVLTGQADNAADVTITNDAGSAVVSVLVTGSVQ
jgi:prepilin-type N-terminal cleavage/methylation domain-containing protein